jgi:hypothetical protein
MATTLRAENEPDSDAAPRAWDLGAPPSAAVAGKWKRQAERERDYNGGRGFV